MTLTRPILKIKFLKSSSFSHFTLQVFVLEAVNLDPNVNDCPKTCKF